MTTMLDSPARLPLPAEIIALLFGDYLEEDLNDPGTYLIHRGALREDPADPGTYISARRILNPDPTDPGFFLKGAT